MYFVDFKNTPVPFIEIIHIKYSFITVIRFLLNWTYSLVDYLGFGDALNSVQNAIDALGVNLKNLKKFIGHAGFALVNITVHA